MSGEYWLLSGESGHKNPSNYRLTDLAAIRGSMWPQCGPNLSLPVGPRPCVGGKPVDPTNIIATDFFADYSPKQQLEIIAELKSRGYTHVVMGPLVDSDGYHGIWTPHDWRTEWDTFLDLVQLFWDHDLAPIVFIHPDGWTLEQTKELTPLLLQPRAQQLLRIVVPTGWEPTQYGWSSWTWAAFGQWARETLPKALVLLHTVADTDAPVGTDDLGDDNGRDNAEGWARVAQYFHGWLTQSSAFANPNAHGDPNHPANTNAQNWINLFNPNVSGSYQDRFQNGYAGWPTSSAWGEGHPLRVYAAEWAAYFKFWPLAGPVRTEAEGCTWGDAAINAGADGALDGCTIGPVVHA